MSAVGYVLTSLNEESPFAANNDYPVRASVKRDSLVFIMNFSVPIFGLRTHGKTEAEV